MNSILIINHVNSRNLGDKALLYATIDLVNHAIGPDEIFVWSFFPKYEKDLEIPRNVRLFSSPVRSFSSFFEGLKVVVNSLLTLLWAFFYRATKFDASPILFSKENKLPVFSLKRVSLVLVRGGDNLSDVYGLKALFANLYNVLIAKVLKKKVVFVGHTIGPFNRKILMHLVSYILRRGDYIIVRDEYSKRILDQMNIDQSKVQFLLDVAFLLEPSDGLNLKNSEKLLVGLVPSDLVYRYWFKERSKGNKYLAYVKILVETVDYLTNNCNADVLLIPHVSYPGNDDMKVAVDIYKKVKDKKKVQILNENNPRRVKWIISQLDLLISPRMHPIIHALSSGTPVLGIDYNFKTKELMRFFGLEGFVINTADLDFPTIKRKLIRLIHDHKNMKVVISTRFMEAIQKNKKTYMKILQNFAQSEVVSDTTKQEEKLKILIVGHPPYSRGDVGYAQDLVKKGYS